MRPHLKSDTSLDPETDLRYCQDIEHIYAELRRCFGSEDEYDIRRKEVKKIKFHQFNSPSEYYLPRCKLGAVCVEDQITFLMAGLPKNMTTIGSRMT